MSADAVDALSRLHCLAHTRCSPDAAPGWGCVRDGARAALAALGASPVGWEPCTREAKAIGLARAALGKLDGLGPSVVNDGARWQVYAAALVLIGDGVSHLVCNLNDSKGFV